MYLAVCKGVGKGILVFLPSKLRTGKRNVVLAAHLGFLKVSVSLFGGRNLTWNKFSDTSAENTCLALLMQAASHFSVLINISGEQEVLAKLLFVTKGFVPTSRK